MTTTELDTAHAEMQAALENDEARLRFYERLADSELFLLLVSEPEGDDDISPEVIETEGTQYVLVFDREERLSAFAERIASYAAVSGRGLADMLSGQGIGMALNLGAPSSILIPPQALEWLVGTLANTPLSTQARPVEFHAPKNLPEVLIKGLDRKLATAVGLARSAFLVGVVYDNDAKGHLLAFSGAKEGSENALANAVSEALTFSGVEAGILDVTFVLEDDPIVETLGRVGLRFDLPQPEETLPPGSNPGMDPEKPPKLR